MIPGLAVLAGQDHGRARRDRLELLAALIDAPGFDPAYRADVIEIPAGHPVYGWACQVGGCGCVGGRRGLCNGHAEQWRAAREAGAGRAEFVAAAVPIAKVRGMDFGSCRICPERPARGRAGRLCEFHHARWRRDRAAVPGADFAQWLTVQAPLAGHGTCRVPPCLLLAASPAGLCLVHGVRYRRAGSPGNVRLPAKWADRLLAMGLPVPVSTGDEVAFRRWCSSATPVYRDGMVNLTGLQPLVKAEIQWGMNAHAQLRDPFHWRCAALEHLAVICRAGQVCSLFDLLEGKPGARWPASCSDSLVRMIVGEITEGLRPIYYSPDGSREAGFIETDHFGRRFPHTRSHYDLTAVPQRWLRDMLWDHLAAVLQSPRCPRTRGPFDNYRKAATELGAFLEADAPEGGHDPALLREEHAQRFAADQRHRARHGLQARGITRIDGSPSAVTEITRRVVFNHLHVVAYRALESGLADAIGLDRAFITALPPGGAPVKRSRSPFSDEMARALASEDNLRRLAQAHDPNDRGLRDVWEAIVYTGRRCSEILGLRLDCTGRYRGLAMLWHDQTKVGNYNEAIRIPEILFARLGARQAKTLARFEDRHGRQPTAAERTTMALFPTDRRNRHEDRSISYELFNARFREWVTSLDVGHAVAHQARHTMATNLLRAGASLAHIRRYLGQVSDRMAEHYVKVAHSDLEDVLNAVWVAGPGSDSPGKLLSGGLAPLEREEALALTLDLSRRSTPADGGFCTFQPVVNGGACPWNLDCENCGKFVMSGADLLYWRRKQEQWRAIAERAPDDATADYLHQVFEPTARAIDGLEKALAGLGLLDQALALDLRRPQDYFHRIWSTAFRVGDLAGAGDAAPPELPAEPA
jgi:site-specific recombinase XerD